MRKVIDFSVAYFSNFSAKVTKEVDWLNAIAESYNDACRAEVIFSFFRIQQKIDKQSSKRNVIIEMIFRLTHQLW